MLSIGETDFYMTAAKMSPADFEAYSSRLFDEWEARVSQELPLEDYALLLEVEEGSIRGSGKIKTTAKALFYVVCGYGSLIQGLQYLRDHASAAGSYLSEFAQKSASSDSPPIVKKKSGAIGQLQRLFVKVEHREMSVEEAVQEAGIILGEDPAEASELLDRITESLRKVQLKPEQISLPLDGVEEDSPMDEPEKKRQSKVPKPLPAIPPASQVRVEVWKESKRGKKKIKVTNIR
jgi:hypothetical protein